MAGEQCIRQGTAGGVALGSSGGKGENGGIVNAQLERSDHRRARIRTRWSRGSRVGGGGGDAGSATSTVSREAHPGGSRSVSSGGRGGSGQTAQALSTGKLSARSARTRSACWRNRSAAAAAPGGEGGQRFHLGKLLGVSVSLLRRRRRIGVGMATSPGLQSSGADQHRGRRPGRDGGAVDRCGGGGRRGGVANSIAGKSTHGIPEQVAGVSVSSGGRGAAAPSGSGPSGRRSQQGLDYDGRSCAPSVCWASRSAAAAVMAARASAGTLGLGGRRSICDGAARGARGFGRLHRSRK